MAGSPVLLDANAKQVAATSNLEAEQALIGIVLYENSALHLIEGIEAAHFAEPVHGRLWAAMTDRINRGSLAEAVLLDSAMRDDPAYRDLGGMRWLSDLIDKSPAATGAPDFAAEIVEFATRRSLAELATEAAKAARTGAATSEVITGHLEAGLLALSRPQARTRLLSASEAAQQVLDHLDEPEHSGGLSYGIAGLDSQLGRMQADELILIGGRPGMGKSALAGCIALNVAKAGTGVIEINGEMTARSMMWRHLTDIAYLEYGWRAPSYKDIKRRTVSAAQRQMIQWAADQVRSLPLSMLKKTGITLGSLRSMIRREAARMERAGTGLGLITIDHVGLMAGEGRDRYSDQTALAIGLKVLAGEIGIPIIALTQLNRQVEQRDNKRPGLSDMRDSGAWEENADAMIGIYREAYYASREAEPTGNGLKWDDWDRKRKNRTIEAIALKVREGEEGTVNLWASIGHNAIRDAAPAGSEFNQEYSR